MRKKITLNEEEICNQYISTEIGIEALAKKYSVGKLRIKDVLARNGIPFKVKGGQKLKIEKKVDDWRVKKFKTIKGFHYVAKDKNDGFTTNDYENRAGILTTRIKEVYGIETPSLYDRRMYYIRTGNYWWEQWFEILQVKDEKTKKCPYCSWETIDMSNKSGAFEAHLKKVHNISLQEYISNFQDDKSYFHKYQLKEKRLNKLKKANNFVTCPICKEKYEKLTEAHMKSYHNMSLFDFRQLYPYAKILSNAMNEQTLNAQKKTNLTVSKKRFISKYEKEIRNFLKNNGIAFEANRLLLIGKEIDILIPSHKIGIEFDGLKWHTEDFGKKTHGYHLDKTLRCNEQGYKLIHIFEDEYVANKELVLNKLAHFLHLNEVHKIKIGGRKCTIRKIYSHDAKEFLNKYHIQGFSPSTFYYGAFFKNELVGVMSFKKGNLKANTWELTRYATNFEYIYQGVGGKLFHTFLNEIKPEQVISFADRRWTIDINNNLYTKIGFKIANIGKPDYKYYNDKVDKYKRFHKLSFTKQILHKKYGFPLTMTEREMTRELGYDRIWDCGLIKYVYRNVV